MGIINSRYKEYKLDNGLVVALQNTPTQTVAAKLRVNYGSSHEREGEEGLAHYLEHCLVTGGSEKYDPVTADEIRGSFGYSNASTNIGRTCFIGQMLTEDLEPWIDYISDHVLRPRFDHERINGERERVLREISDAKSDPMHLANAEFNNIFYRGHPKGRFNLGKEDVVKNASQNVLRSFHGAGYHPNNMDLILVGGLPNNVEELVRDYFGKTPRGENTRKEFPEFRPLGEKTILRRPAPERLNADNPEESSAQIFLRYLGPVSGHKDEYAVITMNRILGKDTNSLLFQNVGLKKGLAYSIETTRNGDYNCGELGINAAVSAHRIDEAIDAIFEEIHRIKTQRSSDRSVERMKRMAKYAIAETFETNDGHVSAIESKLDEGLTPELVIEGFDRVSPEMVMEAANRYLPNRENGDYVLYIRDPLKR